MWTIRIIIVDCFFKGITIARLSIYAFFVLIISIKQNCFEHKLKIRFDLFEAHFNCSQKAIFLNLPPLLSHPYLFG